MMLLEKKENRLHFNVVIVIGGPQVNIQKHGFMVFVIIIRPEQQGTALNGLLPMLRTGVVNVGFGKRDERYYR